METKIEEIWKDVVGYEKRYLVSNLGIIKNAKKGNILRPRVKKGYESVSLFNLTTKKQCTVLVHRIVAMSFIKNEQNKPCINHRNTIKNDNSADNLEWCTNFENMQHAFKMGLLKIPKTNKLNASDVVEIRHRHNKITCRSGFLAKEYNVSADTIGDIIARRSWKHI